MNRRLSAIAALIPAGKGMIDVGTDHGYLPAELALSGYPGLLFASDINAEPLAVAKKTAAQAGVSNRIHFLRCDGLKLCPPDAVDTIVIAGMGGDLIVRILDEAEWCMDRRYRLILQPMTKPEVVRYWLVYNEFEIESETLVEDGGILYQIVTASFGGQTRLNDAELFVGKRSLNPDRALYGRMLEIEFRRFERAITGMAVGGGDARWKLYREIRDQLKEMREDI